MLKINFFKKKYYFNLFQNKNILKINHNNSNMTTALTLKVASFLYPSFS